MSDHESTYVPKTGIEKWLDARLPIVRFGADYLSLPTPKNLNYLYTFVGILTVCLMIQIITAIVMAMHYTPITAIAFASVSMPLEQMLERARELHVQMVSRELGHRERRAIEEETSSLQLRIETFQAMQDADMFGVIAKATTPLDVISPEEQVQEMLLSLRNRFKQSKSEGDETAVDASQSTRPSSTMGA